MILTFETILQALHAHPSGGAWAAKCPAHDDQHESLRVWQGGEGQALFCCHAGCSWIDVCHAMGWEPADVHGLEISTIVSSAAKPTSDSNQPRGPLFDSPIAVLDHLAKRFGRPCDLRHDYYCVNGDGHPQLVGGMARWNQPNGKKAEIRPFARGDDGKWCEGGMPPPRPLYRLIESLHMPTVAVFEGEGKTDLAAEIGMAAVTSAHGAQAPEYTDWSPLAGKDVPIFIDHDAAGMDYGLRVAQILTTEVTPPAHCCIVELPGLEAHQDLVDWVKKLKPVEDADYDIIRARITDLVMAAPTLTPAEIARKVAAREAEKSKTKSVPALPLPDGFHIEIVPAGYGSVVTYTLGDFQWLDKFDLRDGSRRERSAKGAAGKLGLATGCAVSIDNELTRRALDKKANDLPDIVDTCDFCAVPLTPPDVLIEGLLHQGTKLSLGGGSKSMKTWMLLHMSLCVAYGRDFLGMKCPKPAKVLYLNFELPKEFAQERLIRIAEAMHIHWEHDRLQLWNLRGHSAPHHVILPRIAERIEGGGYGLVTLDPLYKLLDGSDDENAANSMAVLMNNIEKLCVRTGAANAFGQHFSKGNQSMKAAIDRVSGSGVFSRDPDSLVTMTAHSVEECFVLEATLRNFPPFRPLGIRWQYPLFTRDESLDPKDLKPAGPAKKTEDEKVADAQKRIQAALDAFPDGDSESAILASVGLRSSPTTKAALLALRTEGIVVDCDVCKSNRKQPYPGIKRAT